MAFSFQPKVVSDGLVLCIDAGNTKSYPGSGTVWTDLSSTAITGSLTNGPTFNTSNGGSIVFDGTNDYVDFRNNLNFEITSPFTVSTWFRTTKTGEFVGVIAGKNKLQVSPADYTGYSIGMNVVSGSSTHAGKFGVVFVSSPFVSLANVMRIQTSASYNDGNWVNGVVTYNGSGNRSGMAIYINGTSPATESYDSNSISGTMITTASFQLGARDGTQQPFSGSIGQVLVFNRVLSATEVLQNYTALSGRFGKTPAITDYDALNFVNAALISNETQQIAINTLTTDLKNAGLWSKMKAIYPFVGGTAASHKWNLKDPRDVDAAFRLTFSGGWTHSSTGALPNGTNGYADTFLIPSTTLTNNSTHLAYYSRTAASSGTPGVSTGTDIGALSSYSGNIPLLQLVIRGDFQSLKRTVSNHYSALNQIDVEQLSGQGLFVGTRTSISVHKSYKNGSTLVSDTNNSNTNTTSVTHKLYIAARNDAGSANQYGNKEASFVSIGDGLTDTDAANLYTIVQKYQTTLGRQV